MRKTATAATPATTTTTSGAPREGGAAPDLWERLAAPFAAEEVRSRRGPRGDLRYITARTARRRLNEVLGPANWSCRVEPADHWVRCSLTIILPDGKAVTREAVGGYPDMPDEEDRVKGGDSDAFKRACVLFGIGEYLYGDEPAEPVPADADDANGNGRGEPRNVPRDRISFPDARAFYGWLKDNGHLALAEEIGNREVLPVQIIHWSPEQIDAGHPGNPRADGRTAMKAVIVKLSFTRTGQQVLEPVPAGRHYTTKRSRSRPSACIPDHHDLRVIEPAQLPEAHAWAEYRRRQLTGAPAPDPPRAGGRTHAGRAAPRETPPGPALAWSAARPDPTMPAATASASGRSAPPAEEEGRATAGWFRARARSCRSVQYRIPGWVYPTTGIPAVGFTDIRRWVWAPTTDIPAVGLPTFGGGFEVASGPIIGLAASLL